MSDISRQEYSSGIIRRDMFLNIPHITTAAPNFKWAVDRYKEKFPCMANQTANLKTGPGTGNRGDSTCDSRGWRLEVDAEAVAHASQVSESQVKSSGHSLPGYH